MSFGTRWPFSFTMTRPATVSGRSIHVLMIMPPYCSTLRRTYGPSQISGFSLMRNVGESLWAAMMRKSCTSLSGMVKAITADPFRVTTYLWPGSISQSSSSRSSMARS